ncbi:hypothetical protein KUTeg_004745 [Tegillarca granosa]|uniref:L-xylulose reductase n=1 Tax=Tegillarca granosa TaxID=220873 RepID=A0ABQ9FL02_TEGGR|nr:hypothetical protein KUTeg_004745 [Tegillarca granosa]
MAYNFTGKRALVTGGSRGIGKVIVKDLIDAGAEVFALAKTQANLDKLKYEIPNVNIIAVDLADWDATRKTVEIIVSPTGVRTELFEKVMNSPDLKKVYDEMLVRHPLGKITEMKDVSNAVMFLLSDKASMITGTILPVDSGYMFMKMAYNFTGKRALVTGGSRGIGKVIVKDLIDAGAEVYALAKTQTNLDKLKSEIPNVNLIAVDLADWDATRIAVENIGDVDLLVNNAVFFDEKIADYSFIETPYEFLEQSINVNLKSAFNISQVVARNMMKRSSGGAIINVSSLAGLRPFKGVSFYCVSKAGMDMMTKVMALELGPHNIRVNTVSPTNVRTERFEKVMNSPDLKKIVKQIRQRTKKMKHGHF